MYKVVEYVILDQLTDYLIIIYYVLNNLGFGQVILPN